MKKPVLEKIDSNFGSSFTIRTFTESQEFDYSTWHFHPEFEIVYINNGRGKRHVGNHISNYKNGDLVFLGPNLPHLCFSDGLMEEHIEVVVQMKEDFLGKDFFGKTEMTNIKQLFERSKQGLVFRGKTKELIGARLLKLEKLENFDRLIELLSILNLMATTTEYELLNAEDFAFEVNAIEKQRIEKIYQYVEKNFKEQIQLPEIAAEVFMTVPAFCRYFKKIAKKTFVHFVNEYKVAHACKLLSDTDMTISQICLESGFNNFSHFNNHFKQITGISPSQYRKQFMQIVK